MFHCIWRLGYSTFRRKNALESDDSLRARNREYRTWTKLLRECEECYGQDMEDTANAGGPTMLWHGVSTELTFDSTVIKLHGPLSTTAGLVYAYYFCYPFTHFSSETIQANSLMISTDFTINYTIFGAEGIVVDIKLSVSTGNAVMFVCSGGAVT